MKQKGFTITEIMIVVVILGILAGIGLPNYYRSSELAKSNEARVNLNSIYMGEKIYFLNNGVYWPAAGVTDTNITNIQTNLNIDVQSVYYTLSVTGGGATFTATASRGNAGNKQFTIDQTGTITENGSY